MFSFATIIGWSFYGRFCLDYLTKERAGRYFCALLVPMTFFGCLSRAHLLWELSDIFNGLLALPNLIALLLLFGQVKKYLPLPLRRKNIPPGIDIRGRSGIICTGTFNAENQ
jgi:Na+/alanine symporter